jgi:hypothetical protein
MSFSGRVLHVDPGPGPLWAKLADATGYLLSSSTVLPQAGRDLTLFVIMFVSLACPSPRGLTGNHRFWRTQTH